MDWYIIPKEDDLMHYGVKGMKWRYKKGPTVKGATQYRKKTGADYGAEVGYDSASNRLRNTFSSLKASPKQNVKNEKGVVSPKRKKEITEVYRSFLKKVATAYRGGNIKVARSLADAANRYYNKLSRSEKKYADTVAKTYGGKNAKFFRIKS